MFFGMPKFFEADVLGPSTLHPIQGQLDVNSSRLNHFVEQFERMKSDNVAVPMFWGHQMERDGPKHSDDRATERARWQAGNLSSVKINRKTGNLRIRAVVPPGMDIDPETKTLIDPVNHTRHEQFSVGIGDWNNGRNRWYEDAIVHVALTPLPVWVWQDGVSESPSDQLIALSAEGRVRVKYTLGATMPATMTPPMGKLGKPGDDEDEVPDAEAVPEEAPAEVAGAELPGPDEEANADKGDSEPVLDVSPGDDVPELGENPNEDDPEVDEPVDADESAALIEQLGELGIKIPDDTTVDNFIATMKGVVSGLLAAGARITVGGEKELTGLTGANVGGAQVESPPMFTLSTGEPTPSGLSPREQAMANALAEGERGRCRERCKALVVAGIPEPTIARIREKLTRVHLSVDPETKEVSAVLPDAVGDLEMLEELVASGAIGTHAVLTATLSTAEAKPNPARNEKSADADAEHKRWMVEQAEKMYGKGAVPGEIK